MLEAQRPSRSSVLVSRMTFFPCLPTRRRAGHTRRQTQRPSVRPRSSRLKLLEHTVIPAWTDVCRSEGRRLFGHVGAGSTGSHGCFRSVSVLFFASLEWSLQQTLCSTSGFAGVHYCCVTLQHACVWFPAGVVFRQQADAQETSHQVRAPPSFLFFTS